MRPASATSLATVRRLIRRDVYKRQATYNALLFIPSRAPFNYYTKEYEKGLQLYASGVLIMDRCADLLPDHFSFVKGLVDSQDLSLNISREMLQHDSQLKLIDVYKRQVRYRTRPAWTDPWWIPSHPPCLSLIHIFLFAR